MKSQLKEDISGKTWDFSAVLNNSEDSIKGLYVYNNIFNLIPPSIGEFKRLRTFKFFANEINLFPSETGNLMELQSLQVKISSPGISGLSLQKLKALKEIELSKVPPRSSVFPLLMSKIANANLKCLKELAVCHFSIRYLPPEIGCLSTLQDLDLSFNKLKSLPQEITSLDALRSFKVANNKLEELPIGLSLLQRLETLDLSNNRLSSLGSLELVSMKNLKKLELQYNKLLNCCQIPTWICCNLEGNGKDTSNDEYISCSSSIDVDIEESQVSSKNVDSVSSSLSSDSSSSRCSAEKRIGKRWKRRIFLQQRACQERLNSVRNRKSNDHQHMNVDECKECKQHAVTPESLREANSLAKDFDDEHAIACEEDDKLILDSICPDKSCNSECSSGHDASPDSSLNKGDEKEGDLSTSSSKNGFYDAGRNRPFMPLESYEESLCLDSREIILVDRERDNELDVIASSAKVLLSRMKQPSSLVEIREHLGDDDLQRATLLALFVSNWFGGGDRSNLTVKMQKVWSGSNYQKPFVCTCQTGNGDGGSSSEQILSPTENFDFLDLCEKSIRIIKQARNSNVVPIGTLRWGVCRHRAVLMKYLCDRMVPPIPCELVRGYLDFSPHAWNIIPVRRDGSLVRMVVDACCPTDIREERDPEYSCRYIPSSRINVSITTDDVDEPSCSFPSSSLCDKVKTTSSSLMRYNFGSVEAVAKVRTLNTSRVSDEKVREFEYTCLGEVRMLGALKNHPCIVEMYGHQIFSKWVSPVDGSKDHRVLQSAIWMEYFEGGSLKNYIEKLSKNGEKHLQVELAMFIARDIACALVELHSKHIIHRDIKSENVLIDLENKRSDGTPVVKLCDFDIAVPLRSLTHTCCIAHHGVPPPCHCVGTSRWMAPEVFQTMHQHHHKEYGLEVDIWSYGCLLLELLTLEIPYAGLCDPDIHELLQSGQRPPLTDKLDAIVTSGEPALVGPEVETDNLRFLVDLFCNCTQGNPHDRPTAAHIYDTVNARINSMSSSTG
ncbi:Mitogen-activated protein kinase kinase kinase yoda [Thalictrum thalictroides]|uniref:Mitogen-activated protein kinase kinase kinase yoda n=1 Tax=Thalictrum thalictroides TaxID=46969 RepID=A0A7J6VL95_THATH|nr:Mitogen-activated protein kinase kinase kinase yoda [Thalictrum thalictroides]